jgi:hypothetical protein
MEEGEKEAKKYQESLPTGGKGTGRRNRKNDRFREWKVIDPVEEMIAGATPDIEGKELIFY